MRSLFGRRLRYPIATDFAVSNRLFVHLLAQDVWRGDINAEVWLPAEVMSGEFKIGQALLTAKSGPRESAGDLTSTLDQVAGPVFAQMQQRVAVWQRSRPSQPVPVFGSSDPNRVESIAINPAPMMESFGLACQTLPDIWGVVLPPATLLALKKLGRVPESQFLLSDDLWARIVYDFAVGYRLRALGRDHLMGALAPLYLAWLASFAREIGKSSLEDAEARLEILSLAFEAQKPDIISRWRWPDRFNP
jgi:glucosylglycerate synthase